MEKMLAIVFDDREKAYEGVRALSALDAEASLILNRLAVIRKNLDGTVSIKRVDDAFSPPAQTLAGTAVGGLIGMLGGPIGAAIGAVAGTLIGLIGDLSVSEVDADFLSDVSAALTAGRYAVLAEVEESRIVPTDVRMEALGGVVLRMTGK